MMFLVSNSCWHQIKILLYFKVKCLNACIELASNAESNTEAVARYLKALPRRILLDSAGANPLCVKRIVGYSARDITADVYTHKSISELISTIDLI